MHQDPQDIIRVTRPTMPPLSEFTPYLDQIWQSRVLTNGGPFHAKLETELADYLGVPHVALFNNATIALIVALHALGIQGEVITTPFSFVATAHSLLWNNITPVFVDVEPGTLNLDPARIEAAITERTSAIMPVHCYGTPADYRAIDQIAARHGLKVIYDAAHAFGVRDQNGSVLNHGDLSVLSFHATKVFNTFEGGAIVCPTLDMKLHIDRLKNFGHDGEIRVVETGINGKMSEINAAFGLLQLKYIDDAIGRRGLVDTTYRQQLSLIPGIRCLEKFVGVSNFAYFPILVDANYPMSRDLLYEHMKANGVHPRRYFFPLISEHAMYRHLSSAGRQNLTVAANAADCVLCLPIYPDLDSASIERIAALIANP